MRHRFQTVVAAFLALACAACGFVQRATDDGFGVSYDELTALIANVEARRAANEPFGTWVDDQGTLRNRCESWDEALGQLYARRSSAIVRDQTYLSLAGTSFTMAFETSKGLEADGPGAVLGAAGWALICVCLVPIDIVVAPIWFVSGAIGDIGVSDEELVRAASDLQRAREFGVNGTRVEGTGSMGWPYPHNTHLDALGYDAGWLRRNAR